MLMTLRSDTEKKYKRGADEDNLANTSNKAQFSSQSDVIGSIVAVKLCEYVSICLRESRGNAIQKAGKKYRKRIPHALYKV